jgi:hypothetical protein
MIFVFGAMAPKKIEQAIVFGHFEVSQSVFIFNTLT